MTSKKDLISIYNASVDRPLAKSSKKSSPSIKPSMLGSPCLRKNFYSYNKVEQDVKFPLRNARIVKLGDAIGKMLFEAFEQEGVAIKYRKPDGTYYKDFDGVTDDYEFRLTFPDLGVKLGKIDMVCILEDGLWLSEFKSINERGYKALRGPKPDHLIQGVLYLYLFNLALKEGKFKHIEELDSFTKAKGMRFLYYHKNGSDLKEFVVTEADQIFRDIVTKIQQIKWYSDNDVLPDGTQDYCNTCPWQKKCSRNQKS